MTLHIDPPAPASHKPWLRYYDPGVPTQIDYPSIPLADLPARAAATYPNRVASHFLGHTLTYAALSERVDRFAGALHDIGVRRGDRVAIMLPNCPQFVIAFYGVLRLGAVAVPTNPLYKEHEIAHQLADAGAETLVVLDILHATARKALPHAPVRHTIVTGIQDFLPPLKARLYPLMLRKKGTPLPHLRHAPVQHFMDMLTHEPWSTPTPTTPGDLAVLQYTGGTTGVSKGAMLTNRNLLANAIQTVHWSPAEVKDKLQQRSTYTLCVTPFFHVYGLTVGMNMSVYAGATMLLQPRFVVKDVLKAIRTCRPELFPGVPTMYLALANAPKLKRDDCASLKACISGSAPLPLEVQQAFEQKTGGHVVEGYGLTEAAPVAMSNPLGRPKIGTVGVPFPDTEAAILDQDTGLPLPQGEIGEIAIRGPQVMPGYWNRPDETDKVLKDGWLLTGDIGRMDEEGYFSIIDRKKDIIIAGGFNIYPREVEEALYEHPAVQEAAVAGVPDGYRGETVKAFIVLKPGMQTTEKDIIAFSRQHLAAFKAPTQVEFLEALPKTAIGKVLRRELTKES